MPFLSGRLSQYLPWENKMERTVLDRNLEVELGREKVGGSLWPWSFKQSGEASFATQR